MNTTFKHTIETNFDESIIYTTSIGKDLKIEVRALARELNKLESDFIIKKI